MGKVAEFAREWLDECGYDLGYDYHTMPSINDCKRIREEFNTGNFESIGKIVKENKMNLKEYWEEEDER